MDDHNDRKSFSNDKYVFPLFPSTSGKDGVNNASKSLFPSACPKSESLSTPHEVKKGFDWLENKSYTSETADKLVSFQQELEQTLQQQSRASAVETDDNEHDEESTTSTRERSVVISSDDSGERGHAEKRKKKHKHKHKKKHKKHKADPDDLPKSKPKTAKKEAFSSNKVFLEEMGDLHLEDAYRMDRRADRNSWVYGSLYKQHVAKYRLLGPSCIGTQGGDKILLYDSRKSSKKHKPWHYRYFGKENRSLINSIGVEVETTAFNSNFGSVEGPYIELCSSKGNNDQPNMDVRNRLLDQSTMLYVQGKGAEGTASIHDTDEDKYKRDSKVETYNRKLRESPNDIWLWLEFVKFQDSTDAQENVIDNTEDSEKKLKKNQQAISEKKISILEKALEANPGNIDLKLAMQELRAEFCELTKIIKELEQLLFIHPANTKLWKYFLMYNQSKLSLFTVAKVTKQYHKCFKTLAGIMEGKVQTHSVPANLDREFLEIFVQYCHFLKQSGHKEKAVASFQALLEFNLFCPASLAAVTRETKMADFEEFWDSNTARLGAAGARGWEYWNGHREEMGEHTSQSEENLEDLEEEILGEKVSKCATWLQMEALRERHHWLPWQPSEGQTEEDCEDVDRLVLFDDIAPVVYNIPAHLHLLAVVEFLTLLGVDVEATLLAQTGVKMTKCGMFCEKATEFMNLNLQKRSSVFESLEMCKSVVDFITNFLTLLISHFIAEKQTRLTLLLISFMAGNYLNNGNGKVMSKSEKKELRKFVKKVLKEERNRNNLVIWSAYVALERLIGKAGDVEAIVETALSMHGGVSVDSVSEQTCGLLALYRQYVEILLNMDAQTSDALWEKRAGVLSEKKQTIIQVLNCAFEGKLFRKKQDALGSSSILKTRLKCKKLIQSSAKQIVDANNGSDPTLHSYFLEVCRCHALFEYCTSGLDSSIGVYNEAISVISVSKPQVITNYATSYSCDSHNCVRDLEQRLYISQVQLVQYHMSTTPTPLHILRHCLDTAMDRFPDNPTILRLFVDIERWCRVSGRLHKRFDHLLRDADTPAPCLFAVCSQLEFMERTSVENDDSGNSCYHGNSIVHRTRSWLERSLSRSSLQHCPLIWRLYFHLELHYGDGSRLKGVFYRAIQQCPWVKELYMDGVRMFGESQHQGLVDMMTEKEFRVQIPVEELDILMA